MGYNGAISKRILSKLCQNCLFRDDTGQVRAARRVSLLALPMNFIQVTAGKLFAYSFARAPLMLDLNALLSPGPARDFLSLFSLDPDEPVPYPLSSSPPRHEGEPQVVFVDKSPATMPALHSLSSRMSLLSEI